MTNTLASAPRSLTSFTARPLRPSRALKTRGFTLLEILLAAAIATLVAVAALSLFLAFTGADKRLQARSEEHSQLGRVHLVVQRTFSSLVLSERAQTVRPNSVANATPVPGSESGSSASEIAALAAARGTTGGAKGASTSGAPSDRSPANSEKGDSESGRGTTGAGDPAPPKPPPRMILEVDQSPAAILPAVELAPGQTARRLTTRPQRLELVLSASPVPNDRPDGYDANGTYSDTGGQGGISRTAYSSSGDDRGRDGGSGARSRATSERRSSETSGLSRERRTDSLSASGENADDIAAELNDAPMRAVRGAFELRPQRTAAEMAGFESADGSRLNADRPLAWELWWVPLAPRRDLSAGRGRGQAGEEEREEEVVEVAAPLGRPFRVAKNIAYMEWRMIVDRQRTMNFQAIYQQDLPAYVELEIETTGGLYANWLFEISSGDYVIAAEVPTPRGAASAAGTQSGSGEAGKGGSSGAPPSGGSEITGAQVGGGKSGGGK